MTLSIFIKHVSDVRIQFSVAVSCMIIFEDDEISPFHPQELETLAFVEKTI